IELDLGAAPFAEEHAIAGLDVQRIDLAVLVAGARAHGDDYALGGLFLGGIGDDDPAFGFFFTVDAADDHAVMQGTEAHDMFLLASFLNAISDLLALAWSEC